MSYRYSYRVGDRVELRQDFAAEPITRVVSRISVEFEQGVVYWVSRPQSLESSRPAYHNEIALITRKQPRK